jgi:6-phosphogluconolactonase
VPLRRQRRGSATISGYRRGPGGALSELASSPYSTGAGAGGLAVSPDGKHLYVTDTASDTLSMFSIGEGGDLTAVSGTSATGSQPQGIVIVDG